MLNRERLERFARGLPPVVAQVGARALRAGATTSGGVAYIRDWRAYRRLPNAERLRLRDVFPQLGDRVTSSPFDRHYFYQDIWAARAVAALGPDAAIAFLQKFRAALKTYVSGLETYQRGNAPRMAQSARLALECGIRGYRGLHDWTSYAIRTYRQSQSSPPSHHPKTKQGGPQ